MTQLLSKLFAAIAALFHKPVTPVQVTPMPAAAPKPAPPAVPVSVSTSVPVPVKKTIPVPANLAPANAVTWIDICRPFTAHFEGCVLVAYADPVSGGDPWTCGYGCTGADIVKGTVWTQEHAESQLTIRLNQAADQVDAHFKTLLTAAQKAVLVDMMFNIGAGHAGIKDGIVVLKSGGPSTLFKCALAHDYDGMAAQILQWDKADGKVVPGLEARAQARHQLFTTGHWEAM